MQETKSHTVWPSPQFWKNLTERATESPDNCAFAKCPIDRAIEDVTKSSYNHQSDPQNQCPFYFQYIHEDLAPWNKHSRENQSVTFRVSRDTLQKAASRANFRIVIRKGRLYVEAFAPCFQTRAIFTIWGMLQLLKFYPDLVPDVDMFFSCGDTPRIQKNEYSETGSLPPPPIFSYCTTPTHFDIPFPDWTFWGWPEVNIMAWDTEFYSILKGANDLLWEERNPTAFWRGNTDTGTAVRKALQGCNGPQHGATIIHQDWFAERMANFKYSKLADQCKHRYKIYAEGWGWSVSLKYIMACDSPALIIDPVFNDFYSRGLIPLKHYWPLKRENLCHSIKFATEWGNNNTIAAEVIGRTGRQYIAKDLSMKHVYDYMLHLLIEYSKVLDFEPIPGDNMKELCTEAFLCQAPKEEKMFYRSSMVSEMSQEAPCFLAQREENLIYERQAKKFNITRLVSEAEDRGEGINLLRYRSDLLNT
ncbi:hypothetical protein KP509_04G011800 [Ceratopteris richardii]|nr:hypothetical protein KP509_04G011800 [Ceratopteris richardii]